MSKYKWPKLSLNQAVFVLSLVTLIVAIVSIALSGFLAPEARKFLGLDHPTQIISPSPTALPGQSSSIGEDCSQHNFTIPNMVNGGTDELKDGGKNPYYTRCNKISITFDYVERTVYVYVTYPNTNESTQQIAIDHNDTHKQVELAVNVNPSTPYYVVLVGTGGEIWQPPHYTVSGTFQG